MQNEGTNSVTGYYRKKIKKRLATSSLLPEVPKTHSLRYKNFGSLLSVNNYKVF